MLMEKERLLIVEYGKKMSAQGLSSGTTGNLSIFDRESGYMAISPSGLGYFETLPQHVVIMDLSGNRIDGECKPSSEYDLHRAVYSCRPDAAAVVHTHSVYCTTFACLNEPLQAVHYMIAGAGTDVIPCAPYQTFGTPELAESVKETMISHDTRAVLMQNHGLTVCHETMAKAFDLAVNLEFVARLQYQTRCIGNPVILDHEEMGRVLEGFKSYGQTDGKKNGRNK